MRFWDSSAVVPLVVAEVSSSALRTMVAEDPEAAVWWATEVECVSAIARRERSGELDPADASVALETLAELVSRWVEVPPTPTVKDDARRVVRTHDLRAADAFQLAAARATRGDRRPIELVTLDERLALAARREGFPVLPV
jgi:predicted nucleic acid-binding protein